jgi:hypothetical protein
MTSGNAMFRPEQAKSQCLNFSLLKVMLPLRQKLRLTKNKKHENGLGSPLA